MAADMSTASEFLTIFVIILALLGLEPSRFEGRNQFLALRIAVGDGSLLPRRSFPCIIPGFPLLPAPIAVQTFGGRHFLTNLPHI